MPIGNTKSDSNLPDRAEPLDPDEAALRRLILGESSPGSSERIVGHVLPALASFLRGRFPTLGAEDAADIAADALVIAMERRHVFDPGRETRVRTWLHGIAQLRAMDFFRRHGRQRPLDDEPDDTEESIESHSVVESIKRASVSNRNEIDDGSNDRLIAAIEEAITALPRQQRRAARSHFLEGRPPRDVDAEFGWRPNTANVYISHARRAIRRRLDHLQIQVERRPTASAMRRTSIRLCMHRRDVTLRTASRTTRLHRGYAAILSGYDRLTLVA